MVVAGDKEDLRTEVVGARPCLIFMHCVTRLCALSSACSYDVYICAIWRIYLALNPCLAMCESAVGSRQVDMFFGDID